METNGNGAMADKGPWVAELEEGRAFIGYYIARNPRLDSFRDPARGKYLQAAAGGQDGGHRGAHVGGG